MSRLPKMNRDRLELLAEALERVQTKKFNMIRWGISGLGVDHITPELFKKDKGRDIEKHCGTSACALGTAAVTPALAELGLQLVRSCDSSNFYDVQYTDKDGITHLNFCAGEVFFGLTDIESNWLFCPLHYRRSRSSTKIPAARVARRIRFLLGNTHSWNNNRRALQTAISEDWLGNY